MIAFNFMRDLSKDKPKSLQTTYVCTKCGQTNEIDMCKCGRYKAENPNK